MFEVNLFLTKIDGNRVVYYDMLCIVEAEDKSM